MGDMGRKEQPSGRKRLNRNSRRGNPVVSAMAFTDDRRKRDDESSKKFQREEALWLGTSLIVSHNIPQQQSNSVMARDAEESLTHLAKAFFGSGTKVSIDPPSRGEKTWLVEIASENNGNPIEFEMESSSLQDVVSNATTWINVKCGSYGRG